MIAPQQREKVPFWSTRPRPLHSGREGCKSALRERKIALCLEQSKGPLIYALLEPAALYSPKLLRICQPVGAPLQLGQALSQGTDGAWQSLSHRHPRPGLQVAAPSCSCAGATASLTMKQSTARVSNAEAHTLPANSTNNPLKPLENPTNNSYPNP